MKQILNYAGQLKTFILLVVFFVTSYQFVSDKLINAVATEVVARTGDQQYRIYKLQRAQDSLRFEAAADLAAKVLVKQDSITFVLSSINLWRQDIDRRIDGIAQKLASDTSATRHQRELIQIRKLLREKEAAEQARIETEQAMREFINRSIDKIEAIKKGDRAQ